jgi:hypothetical protein
MIKGAIRIRLCTNPILNEFDPFPFYMRGITPLNMIDIPVKLSIIFLFRDYWSTGWWIIAIAIRGNF